MNDLFGVNYAWLIPLLPLIGAAIAGFLGAKWLKGNSHWPIWIGVGISAIISLTLLFQMLHLGSAGESIATSTTWFNWIQSGNFKAEAGAWIDPLTAVMLCVITGIGFLITVFAAGYMKGEEGYFRFFAYLGLFIFAMTCLVMGSNLIMLYLGWEGVGLCSYLLIGYYYERPSAVEAAKKAFLVNRIGDFGFGLGIMLIFKAFGTVSFFGTTGHPGFLEMAMNPNAYQVHALQYIPFLLMLGAFGKSAQFPLYVWLPDAMEGPTPVSALIHAATMVTAGVYMIARCSTVFVGNPAAMLTVAAVGCFTALFAATIALRQFDLKKVFAYSTISQLGFMFTAVGVLAPVAGVFHLITHAFFKALLFLSSGVVMHAMAGELDMRKFSGLKKTLPWTNLLMLTGCLALSGCPPFSGFFSKDEIVGACLNSGDPFKIFLGIVLLFTAFLTAYYTFRLYFRVFQGPEVLPGGVGGHGHAQDDHAADAHAHASAEAVTKTGDTASSGHDKAADHSDHAAQSGHGDHGHHNHEPMIMILPLILLAIGAILAGGLNWPSQHLGDFLAQSPSFQHGFALARTVNPLTSAEGFGIKEATDAVEPKGAFSLVMLVSMLISFAGIGLAYFLHLKDRAADDRLVERFAPVARLLEGKYWVDEIYQAYIVQPLWVAGEIFFAIDRLVVDGVVWGVSLLPYVVGLTLRRTTQRGYLQGYAASILFGVVIILLLIFV